MTLTWAVIILAAINWVVMLRLAYNLNLVNSRLTLSLKITRYFAAAAVAAANGWSSKANALTVRAGELERLEVERYERRAGKKHKQQEQGQ